jgi:hypothetical protein
MVTDAPYLSLYGHFKKLPTGFQAFSMATERFILLRGLQLPIPYFAKEEAAWAGGFFQNVVSSYLNIALTLPTDEGTTVLPGRMGQWIL